MAVWYIANNLWTSSETPVDLGIIDGVQTYRVQSLMNAYNNCIADDTLTLDPDSPNFKDTLGYPLRVVTFNIPSDFTVRKNITLSGGKYRLRLDGGTNWSFSFASSCNIEDVDFVNLHISGRFAAADCNFTRCFIAYVRYTAPIDFIAAGERCVFTDCLFAGIIKNSTGSKARFGNGSVLTRCSVFGFADTFSMGSLETATFYGTTFTGATADNPTGDSVVFSNESGRKPSEHCVAPPPDSMASVSDWSKWDQWDFRLKLTSTYATGNDITAADGEVLDLDGVPRKPGGAKGACEVAKSVVYFNTTGWGGTGALSWLGVTKTLWGEYPTYLCSTVDQAISAAPVEGIVSPDPDSASFRDAAGFRLHTVVVNLDGNLTINKSIALAGGAYRLRLDGGGQYYVLCQTVKTLGNKDFDDIDFVNITSNSAFGVINAYDNNVYVRRCLFANISARTMFGDWQGGHCNVQDCAFIGVTSPTYNGGHLYRCTIYGTTDIGGTKSDCVYDSSGESFVKSKGAAADVTDWSDWESSVDLRLKSDSSYASGNDITTADGVVYDLAGNKRKVGGAKGAYEVLDVDKYARYYNPGLKYTVEYESDSAPRVYAFGRATRGASSGIGATTIICDNITTCQYRSTETDDWIDATVNSPAASVAVGKRKHWRVTNDGGSWTNLRLYEMDETAPSNALDCKLHIGANFSYQTIAGGNAGSSMMSTPQIIYVGYNTIYADTASTVKEIIVPGWTHVVLGDVTTTDRIVLGLGATVESSGKLTIDGVTTTSDELMKRVKLLAPAELTLKNSTVTGSDWNISTGVSISFDTTNIIGKLPNNVIVYNSNIEIDKNTTVESIVIKGNVSINIHSNVFLTVKQTFNTFNAGVITLASTGYLAVPYGTDFNVFTAGVDGAKDKLCFYGADVSTISAVITVQTAKIEFTKNAPSIPVLIERKKGTVWESVGLDANVCDVSDDEKQIVFRAFDGVKFIQSNPARRTFFLKNKTGGSFTEASDWTLDRERNITCNSAPQIPDNIFDCRF